MNKYAAESRAAQRERRVDRMCRFKAAYPNEETARQEGQHHYRCPHCGLWHRSGQLMTLATALRRQA